MITTANITITATYRIASATREIFDLAKNGDEKAI